MKHCASASAAASPSADNSLRLMSIVLKPARNGLLSARCLTRTKRARWTRTRYAETVTNALTRPAVSFSGGRTYTITARSDITVARSTACGAANKACLDNTLNR